MLRLGRHRFAISTLAFALLGAAWEGRAESDDTLSKARTAFEAVRRLKGTDLETKPALKAAIHRLANQLQGEPEWVELVQDFNLTNHYPNLLQYAVAHPAEAAAGDALRLLLSADPALVRSGLAQTNQSVPLLTALGTAAHRDAVPMLLPWLAEAPDRSLAIRRIALRGLIKSQEGAMALIELATTKRLAEDLHPLAATELQAVRWPRIRAEAAQVLPPPPRSINSLPPVGELVRRTGDVTRGGIVFRRADAACSTCHQVNGEGTEFGPKLSEIGTKLGKDALYDSILEPSTGISFGYEAWLLSFKNGDELFGLVVSETADEIVVRQSGSLVTKHAKTELTRREKHPQSIMPEGIAASLPLQDLVDLVEYLASLKKATR